MSFDAGAVKQTIDVTHLTLHEQTRVLHRLRKRFAEAIVPALGTKPVRVEMVFDEDDLLVLAQAVRAYGIMVAHGAQTMAADQASRS